MFAACCSVLMAVSFWTASSEVSRKDKWFSKKKKRWCMRWWKRHVEEKDENVFALLGKHSKGYKYKEEWSHSGALQRLKQFVLSYWWFKKCFIFPGHKSTQITRFINLKLSHLLQLVKPSCCRSFAGFKTSGVTRQTVMLREKSKKQNIFAVWRLLMEICNRHRGWNYCFVIALILTMGKYIT